jgi:hypothetical protein
MKKGGDGLVGNVINDIKKNEDVLKPIYDTTATIGIIYSVLYALLYTFIAIIMILVGFWVKNINVKKTKTTPGVIESADCITATNTDEKKNKSTTTKCQVKVSYIVDGKDYNNEYTSSSTVNKGQSVEVLYDPLNPNDFTTGNEYYYIGLGMIIFGFVIMISSWIWLALSIIFKPIAAATGVGAVGDAVYSQFD